MRVSALSNGLSNLAMRVIVTTLALVIVPVTAVSQQENPRRRWEYFYQQRAYPFDRIPAGALQTARRQEVARWPARFAPGASFVATWTPIGPAQITQATNLNSSGRLTAIAIHPTTSSILYIGGAQGGVWKTTDGGTSWSPLTDTQCSLAMGGLAIDPVDPNIIYAGTGEQHFSIDSYYGCGVLRSIDGGATWTQFGGSTFDTNFGGARISRVVVDPRTAGSTTTTTVLAASDFGLYRSTNSGTSWTQVLANTATDIVVDTSTDPTTMYAGLSSTGGAKVDRRWRHMDVLAAITLACSGDANTGGTEPVSTINPGFVNVTLATPNSNDGALLLTLSGGTMDSLAASAGTIFFASTGTNTFRVMVAGTIGDGPVVRFWMPDRRNVSQYVATLEQAAVRSTYEQQDIGGYSLSIAE